MKTWLALLGAGFLAGHGYDTARIEKVPQRWEDAK